MIAIRILFLEFIIYSFLGYILECIYSSIVDKRINFNRGFFNGPYCPIYGATLVILQIQNYLGLDLVTSICSAIVLIAFTEYFTAFVLECIFKRTWWDYSRKKFNIKGRVCLDNLILFGIGSVIINRTMTKEIYNFFCTNSFLLTPLFIFFLYLFFLDLFLSIRKHYAVKKTSS